MTNAKDEFLEEIKDKKLICANISKNRYDDDDCPVHILKENYTKEDFDKFLSDINFEYSSGYGGQELFGLILFEDSYSNRGEYDGSEWWDNHKMPTVDNIYNYKNR